MITLDEEENAREVRDLLKPAWQVTQEICSEKSVTLSKCIPLVAVSREVCDTFIYWISRTRPTKIKILLSFFIFSRP